MSTTLEYRCPNCDGTLSFRSETQQLTCPFCDSELDAQGVKEYNQAIDRSNSQTQAPEWETYASNSGSGAWNPDETANLVVHHCRSCNGEIVADKNMAVSSCPYCDNNIFVPSQFADELRPDYVIPFKLNKEQAKDALREFYKGKPLLNPCFKRENQLDEIKGLYVPFWLYDCDTTSEIHYKTTRVKHRSDSRNNYTTTEHFSVYRSGKANFDKIPADGSSKMNDTFMEALEPYYYNDLVEFTPAYFAGYLADKYDVSPEKLEKRINTRVRSSVIEAFTPRGYASVTPVNSSIQTHKSSVSYALMPVWVLNTQYHGELHTFMMNGQTGKLVGKLPVDKGRVAMMFSGIFASIFLLSSAIIHFLL